MKVIDLECDIPTREVYEEELKTFEQSGSGSEGLANYIHIFGPKWAAEAGMSPEEFEELKNTKTPLEVRKTIIRKNIERAMTEEAFIKMLDEAEVVYACIGTGRHATIEHTAALAARHKPRLIPWARISPRTGVAGVRELERVVKEWGIRGLEVSTFREQLYPNDKKYYPLYTKCVELGIPARIYCTMNYASDRAMDFGRPIFLDEVARDFPELTIIAALGGWPWVPELVGLARRHTNIHIDLAAHRPKNVAKPGSGFEMLLQFGNNLLQDRILFASSWITLGMSLDQVIRETLELPLKDSVKPKWMYENAARILKLE
ncbi:MAG: amidohydrolase family protein [Thermodesulfobacteriota bacterium]